MMHQAVVVRKAKKFYLSTKTKLNLIVFLTMELIVENLL